MPTAPGTAKEPTPSSAAPPAAAMPGVDLQSTIGNRRTGMLLETTLRGPSRPVDPADVLSQRLTLPETPAAIVLARYREEERLEPIVMNEFRQLRKGIIANAKTASQYAAMVRSEFGSYHQYYDFAAVSDTELDRPVGKRNKPLRTYIDKMPHAAQTIFYRWVRKEYVDRGIDPVAVIVAQGGPEMGTRLAAARKATGQPIPAGGFNPRPVKSTEGAYTFGTLSEHATGDAADIEPERNLDLPDEAWRYMQQQVGMKPIDASRKRWRDQASELYDEIAELSRRWAEHAQRLVAAQLWAERKAGTLVGQLRRPDILPPPHERLVLSTEATRRRATVLAALRDVPIRNDVKVASVYGLMTLTKDVVMALRKQNLVWGATFRARKDLHHFEIQPDFPGEPSGK